MSAAITFAVLALTGCLEVSGHPILAGPPVDASNDGAPQPDGGGGDAPFDAGMDAPVPLDGGADGGGDGGAVIDGGGCPDCPVGPDRASDGRTFLYFDISGAGRFVTFVTRTEGSVPEDMNGFSDVFVFDRVIGALER